MASTVPKIGPDEGLPRYLREIKKFPMLSAEEEFALACRWRDHHDVNAAHRLVTSHLRLVAKIAMGYRGYGLPLGELISEGNVGMMQAVRRFDPDRGFRLATYGIRWIRAAVLEYVLRSWSLVKMGTTGAQKKLFFKLRRLKGEMRAFNDGDLRPDQVTRIAQVLEVSDRDVIDMNRRMAASDRSLNMPVYDDGGGEWQDWLPDGADSQETTIAEQEELSGRRALLANSWKVLNDRQRHILTERRMKETPATLDKLAIHYGISRERVRQIELRALETLRKTMRVKITEGGQSTHEQRFCRKLCQPAPVA
jgi:RNA polymerase sigma-32 factor